MSLEIIKKTDKNLIKKDIRFVKNALNSTSFGKLALNVGVLCPSRLK